MRVRDWRDVLADVTDDGTDPEGWRAVAGSRRGGVGEDLYLGHPSAGVYQLKTYAKNPRDLKGVGTRVARKVDDGLDPILPDEDHDGRFAVRQPPADEDEAETVAKRLEEAVKVHAEAPTAPEDFFEDVMDALDSPAFGPMEYEFDGRPDELDELAGTFEGAEELLDAELEELVEEDEVGRGFH
jgi:AcrR family transcriptional regulator